MKRISNVFIFSLLALLLTACVTKQFIIPINKSIKGNLNVVNITVTTSPHIKSKSITYRIKDAIYKETTKRLKGTHKVKLKININDWRPAYDFDGVKTGNRRTTLGIEVTVLDAKTNTIVGKYKTGSFQGNDLPQSPSGKNTNTRVIDSTAYFTAWQLEK